MRLLMLGIESSHHKPWVSAFEANGFGVDCYKYLADGGEALKGVNYDAVITNIRMPDGDGIEWLRECRRKGIFIPMVAITPSADIESRIAALEAGADESVSTSIDIREFIAKMRAILRRPAILDIPVYEAGNVKLDSVSRELWIRNTLTTLPRRELRLLEQLLKSFNRTVTRESLEANLYGSDDDVCPNSIEVRISRLRRSLTQAGADIEIKTRRGIGYVLQRCSEHADIAV